MSEAPTSAISRRACAVALASVVVLAACRSGSADVAADGTLVSPYLAIGDTLASDELDGVSELGAALVEAAAKLGEAPGVAELLAGAGRLGAADIATARLAYRKMSDGVIAHLAANPDARAGLQLVYCPMAFTNAGAYWVQAQGKLRNPYEGAMMLRCGAKIAWGDHRSGAAPAGEVTIEGMDK